MARISLHAFSAPRKISLALVLSFTLLPLSGYRIERNRNTELDIARLRKTECEYRGIIANFEEVTRAYALVIYDQAKLVRWEARPSPYNPDTETLVTGLFTTTGPKSDAPPAEPRIEAARRQALPSFGVAWRYSSLGIILITAHNIYARDALAVFQQTVDGFINQMVLVTESVSLRAGPGQDFPVIEELKAGTMLLLEDQREHWSYIRIPSTQTKGWLYKQHLRSLSHAR